MKLILSVTGVLGVHGAIVHKEELVFGTILCPEKARNELKKIIKESKLVVIQEGTTVVAKVNLSNSFIDSERRVDNAYKGFQTVLVSGKASTKSATLDTQFFLIRKNEEDKEAALKKVFFEKNMQKLPLPLDTDWEEYFWQGIYPKFEKLESFGSVPYEGYVLSLPQIETIQELVEISHVKHEYFTFHNGRVPKMEALYSIGDIKGFNLKNWVTFVKAIGGPEAITSLGKDHQKGLVRAFEILGLENKDIIMNKLDLWHTASLRGINILLRLAKDKNEKEAIKRTFKTLYDKYHDKKKLIYPLIGNFESLLREHSQNIKNKNWAAIEKWLKEIRYDNVTPGCEELAKVCGKASVSATEYVDFEKQFLKNLQRGLRAPKSYPTISNDYEKDFEWEMLDMTTPRAWPVGLETYCCMHPTNVGGVCLEYAAANYSTSGILRIAQKGRTVAQSFMWLSVPDTQGYRIMVLDNIEVAGSELRDSVKNAYKDFGDKMEFYCRMFKIKAITVGTQYSNIPLKEICISKLESGDPLKAAIPSTLRYTDARKQWLLRQY